MCHFYVTKFPIVNFIVEITPLHIKLVTSHSVAP